jgi:UDP-N-acetylmuramoyl-tripeptide--D-alanyl-D-alanine ligase
LVLWQAEDVILATRGNGRVDWSANGVAIDSRTLKASDLFIALKGPAHDGHEHVAQAFKAGAAAAIVSRRPADLPPSAPLVMVDDTFAALQDLGRFARLRAQGTIIGVTGSVGKTGAKEQLRLMLGSCGTVTASQGSYNNHWGVPLSLALLPEAEQWGVFEMGMNHAGEIAALTRQVQPQIALITNVEAVHLEFFPSVEAIADAKAEIFLGMDASGIAVLNRDNPHFVRLVGHARTQGLQQILSFGTTPDCDAQLLEIIPQQEGSRVKMRLLNKALDFRLGAIGRHYAFNALGTLLTAVAAGADMDKCAESLAYYHAPTGRGARENITLPQGGMVTVIDETFNASPVAMRAAITTLGQIVPRPGGRRIAILGDMRELGPTAPKLHAELAAPLLQSRVDLVFACGHLIEGLFTALPRNLHGHYAADSASLAPIAAAALRDGDVVLVKGSKSIKMEKVIAAIRG